jgi:hypothetical protein
MTFHAILEIRNVLIQMPFNDLRLIVFVAAITSVGCKTGWMACGTGGSATMIQRERVLPVEFSRSPSAGVMTRRTLRSELTIVGIILLVAGVAILRRRGEVYQPACIDMTLHAGKTSMAARKLEREHTVIEILIEAIHPVVTLEAGGAKREGMCGHKRQVHLAMTGFAGCQGERGDVIVMAVIASERFTRSRQLVAI